MPNFAVNLLFICILMLAGILAGVSIYAFSEPTPFIQWLSPLYWLTRKLIPFNAQKYDSVLAMSIGSFTLFGLMIILFFLGGLIFTAIFRLWSSPFAPFILPL